MKKELAANHPNIKLVDTVYGNDDDQTSFDKTRGAPTVAPESEGDHLPYHRRHRRRRPLPLDLPGQGEGRADRARHAEPDAQVRQGRHRQGVRAVEPRRPRLPRGVRRKAVVDGDITGKQGDKFKAGKLGEFTVGADGAVLLGDPYVFDASNIDKFNF